jgi:hypothetical protein
MIAEKNTITGIMYKIKVKVFNAEHFEYFILTIKETATTF